MFSLGSEDHWHWGMRFSKAINFCVWSLIQDGLQVGPFTEHPSGHGLLQAAGMTGVDWLAWVREILRRENVFEGRPDLEVTTELLERMLDAPGAWLGTSTVADVLIRLWSRYQVEDAAWEDELSWRYVTGQGRSRRDRLKHHAPLWHDLKPLHSALQPPTIYPVNYPVATFLPVAPRYLLITPVDLESDTAVRLIREGLFDLARLQEET